LNDADGGDQNAKGSNVMPKFNVAEQQPRKFNHLCRGVVSAIATLTTLLAFRDLTATAVGDPLQERPIQLAQALQAEPQPDPSQSAPNPEPQPATPPSPALPAINRPAIAPSRIDEKDTEEKGTPATVVDGEQLESILGKNVISLTGEDMGRIVDVIVDRPGQVRAAIIDFGGFLGVGTRKIAVDWHMIRFPPEGKMENVIIDLTRNQLRVAPIFKPGEPVVVLGRPDATP
jgi:sporulation protein YlmC with PRC-barrel domain